MSKNLILLANTSNNTVSAGNSIPLGGIIRKSGCGYVNGSSSVYINNAGYYLVDFGASYSGTAGTLTLAIAQNGSKIEGASVTNTVEASTYYADNISTIARVYCCAGATITALVDSSSTSTPTFTNVSMRIVKE